jgi:uncharacterized protein
MILTVHTKPSARENRLLWLDSDTLKISVRATPEKGKANAEVIKLLSKELRVPTSSIRIVRGSTTRIKQVEINKDT